MNEMGNDQEVINRFHERVAQLFANHLSFSHRDNTEVNAESWEGFLIRNQLELMIDFEAASVMHRMRERISIKKGT